MEEMKTILLEPDKSLKSDPIVEKPPLQKAADRATLFDTHNEVFSMHGKTYDIPDGEVILYENFFSKTESDDLLHALITNVKWTQEKIKFYGKEMDIPRLTAWYGEEGKPYTYSGISMSPLPWSEDLHFIKSRIEELSHVAFTSVLLNYYRNGKDSVLWHSDDEKELGHNPVIASISFGATRTFQLKHKHNKDLPRVDIPLTHGSLLLMQGTTQHFWQHQIPKTAKPIKERLNLTFRVIK